MHSLRYTKANWPVTLEELIERRDQCTKIESKWSMVFIVVFFGFLLANIPFSNWLDSEAAPKWLKIVWLFVYFAILIGNLPLLYKTTKNRLRSFDLVCPTCSRELNGKIMPMAIATGHCCNCGTLLVSNHPSKSEQGVGGQPATPPRVGD